MASTGSTRSMRLRLTARGRFVLIVLPVSLLVAALLVPALGGPASATSEDAAPMAELVVTPGDTLWAIALRLAPDDDPRETTAVLQRVNALESSELTPGQVLRVPGGLDS